MDEHAQRYLDGSDSRKRIAHDQATRGFFPAIKDGISAPEENMDAKLLWEMSVEVRNSFPVLVRLLGVGDDEGDARLALEIAVERDTLDAPKWLPFDMVPARHQWKMHAAFANLFGKLDLVKSATLEQMRSEHAAATEALNAEWEKRTKELETELSEAQGHVDTATDRAMSAERKLQWRIDQELTQSEQPPPPAATDSNAQLLIQALIRQTELVIERDAARAEAKQFCESYERLNEQQHRLVAENTDLSREIRSIDNSVSQVDGGCTAPRTIHQRIHALGERLREAEGQGRAWRETAEARAAEWRAAVEQTNLKVATEWAERRKRERDEALTTQTLPDAVRQFQASVHGYMGDTFYCDQASRKKSEPGSLNALTADVLDWAMGLHDVLIVVDQNTVTQLRAVGGALAERDELLARLKTVESVTGSGVWVWSDTPEDDLASMGNSMVLTMTAGQLRCQRQDAKNAAETELDDLLIRYNEQCHRRQESDEERDVLRVEVERLTRARPLCDCGRDATCIGRYESADTWSYACSDCCGHGNEDGRCVPVFDSIGLLSLLNAEASRTAGAEASRTAATRALAAMEAAAQDDIAQEDRVAAERDAAIARAERLDVRVNDIREALGAGPDCGPADALVVLATEYREGWERAEKAERGLDEAKSLAEHFRQTRSQAAARAERAEALASENGKALCRERTRAERAERLCVQLVDIVNYERHKETPAPRPLTRDECTDLEAICERVQL